MVTQMWTDGSCVTVLNLAVRYNHLEVLQLLLSEFGAKDLFSANSALCTAAECANIELVRYLLGIAQSDDCTQKERHNYSHVLTCAIIGGSVKIIEYFLRAGAKPGYEDFCNAYRSGDLNVASLLIEYSANVGGSLHQACSAKDPAVLEMLLATGVDVSVQDFTGRTALEMCIAADKANFVCKFLEHEERMQGSPSAALLIKLMKSERPQSFIPSLFEALTMIPDEIHYEEKTEVNLIPSKGLFVSCSEGGFEEFTMLRDPFGERLTSDVLPSHLSWRRRVHTCRSMIDLDCAPTLLFPFMYILHGVLWCLEKTILCFTRGQDSACTTQAYTSKLTMKGCLDAEFLHALVIAADTMGSPEPLFANAAVEALVEFHWCLYGDFAHTCSFQLFVAQ